MSHDPITSLSATDASRAPLDPIDGLLGPGSAIGGYRVVRLIGRGGMGEVYEAWDDRLARPVAVKRIPVARQADAESRARLWREARTLASVRHPGVVTIFEIGEDARSGSLFLAMELVRGRPLSVLGGRPVPARLAVHLAREVALALGAAHAMGVAHRDVKPSNILIEDDGTVRVVDFGLARRTDDDEHLTRSGAMLGTPGYMAPEVVAAAPGTVVGPAADVFAIGTLLYRLCTGVNPFARDSAQATAMAIAGALHTPLGELGLRLPAALVALVERCLALDPAARPPHGTALAEALARIELPKGQLADREALVALVRDAGSSVGDPPLDTRQVASGALPTPRPSARGARRWWLAGGLAGVGAAAAVAVVAFSGRASSEDAAREAPAVARAAEPSPDPAAEGRPPGSTLATGRAASTPARPSGPGGGSDASAAANAGASGPEAGAAFALPPRPAVAVLGFTTEREAERARAEVVADVVRVRLDEDPEHVLVASLDLMDALIASHPKIGPDFPPERLARPGRQLGHIDVVVRGTFRDATATAPASVTAELVETLGARTFDTIALEGSDVMALADRLAWAIDERLGGHPPDKPARLTRVPEAWSAMMAARAAQYAADLGVVSDNLDWALRLDPRFGLALSERLPLYRQEGRDEELVAACKELLAAQDQADGPTLPERERRHDEALLAVVEGRVEDAVRALYALRDRWPFDLESNDLLLAIRSTSEVRDLDEVEKLGRRQLALAPRLEVAASRLIRALGFRHRGADIDALMGSLEIPPGDPTFADVFAEQALFTGRFAEAAEGFRRVVAREPGNLYAEHMAIASDLVGGRCDKAAGAALDRIEKHRLLGKDSLLGWTYSLASQALVCWEQWDGFEKNLAAWEAFDTSGHVQAFIARERVGRLRARLAEPAVRAREEARLVARWRHLLETPEGRRELPHDLVPAVTTLLGETATDPKVLERLRVDAERSALDTASTSRDRADARHFAARLRGRELLVAGRPAAEVLAAFDDSVRAWAEVQGEGDSAGVVLDLTERALAKEQLGDHDGARADWRAILDAGYAHLWVTESWVLARHRLDARSTP